MIEFTYLDIIHCDNTITVSMSKNIILHSMINHISIKYHFLREKFVEKEIRLEYVSIMEKITNIFTKTFLKDTFVYLRDILGVMRATNFLVVDAKITSV